MSTHADGEDAHALPIGTRLNEFELTRRIGEGGFSIVYLAWDHSLDRKVALKEYMPGALAARAGDRQIQPRSERHRETFDAGLKSFINEAKLLARFDHPALVKVYRFWEANGTAYLVMPLYDGMTLKDAVRAMPQPPGEEWLRTLLAPLTAALGVIHAEQCYHRDIAPDNIMLLAEGGKPLLLDFGAARRVIGDMTQALTVILKPGYAPVEQYAEVPGMKQGPWTDVYALAATVYWMILGRTPPPSVGRMLADSYEPLAQAAAGRYSAGFLSAIDRALAVLPERRTQSIDALCADLGLGAVAAPALAPERPDDPDATVIRTRPMAPALRTGGVPTDASLKAAGTATRIEAGAAPQGAHVQSERPALGGKGRVRTGLWIGLVACAALAGAAWWALRPEPAPVQATGSPPVQATGPSPAQATASAPEQVTAPTPVQATAPATAPTPSQALTPAPAIAPIEPAPAVPAEPPVKAAVEPVRQPAPVTTSPALSPPAVPRSDVASVKPARPTPSQPRAAVNPGASPAKSRNADHEAAPAQHSAECARIFQQLSLGVSPGDLMERAKKLGCR